MKFTPILIWSQSLWNAFPPTTTPNRSQQRHEAVGYVYCRRWRVITFPATESSASQIKPWLLQFVSAHGSLRTTDFGIRLSPRIAGQKCLKDHPTGPMDANFGPMNYILGHIWKHCLFPSMQPSLTISLSKHPHLWFLFPHLPPPSTKRPLGHRR